MNPELKSKLVEILASAQATATDAYTLVKTQSPELAREIVLARGIDVGVGAVFYAACGAVSVMCAHAAVKLLRNKEEDNEEAKMGTVSGAIIFGITFIPLGINIVAILQCIFTPRVVFLQEVAKLLR